jgi:ATP-binding cassette subfamily F protein 3
VTRTDYESDEYSQIIEDLDTHRFELLLCWRYWKILLGLGFKERFSIIKRKRFQEDGVWIELAKLLLQANDVLLLDEPTNHLDIVSFGWKVLRNYIYRCS